MSRTKQWFAMTSDRHPDETDAAESIPVVGTAPLHDGRQFKVRNIGIHGARGTGKTCYLACCLYGQSVAEDVAIILGDSPSLFSLQNAWAVLTRGELPQANAVTVPDEICFSLQADRLRWQVRTKDYAGSLVQLSDTGVSELRREVREWLVRSDSVLILLNADLCAEDPDARERMSEIEVLLDQLLANSPDGNTVAKPLALLLTKWDVRGQISDDPMQEEPRARAYLQTHPVFQQIANKIDQAGDRVKVFPVSAFGSHRNGNLPPTGGPQPFNLHAPFVWAVQKADEMLYESAKRVADSWAGPERQWKRYSRAISCYTDLIKKAGINKGPVYDQIWRELQPLKRARFKRRCRLFPLAAIILCAVVFGGLSCEDAPRYSRVVDALIRSEQLVESPASAHEALKSLPTDLDTVCQPYLETLNPLSGWSGHKQKVRDRRADLLVRWDERISMELKQDYQQVEDCRAVHPSDSEAQERLERCEAFLTKWPESPYKTRVVGFHTADDAALARFKRCQQFDVAYEEWQEKITALGDKHDAIVAECHDFLKRFPKSGYVECKAKLENVELMRGQVIAAKDDSAWADVDKFARENPKKYDEIISKANDYRLRTNPPPRFLAEAEKLIAQKEQEKDNDAWAEVDEYVRRSPRDFVEILSRAESYVNTKDVRHSHLKVAEPLIQRKRIEWDQSIYAKVANLAGPAYEHEVAKRKSLALQAARKQAEEYLQSRVDRLGDLKRPEYKRFEDFWETLERWANWVKDIETGKSNSYWVHVKSVRIPEDATYYAEPRFMLTIDRSGERTSTGWLDGRSDGRSVLVDLTIGPLDCRWGKKDAVTVHFEERGYVNNGYYKMVIEDDSFLPIKGQGVVRMSGRNSSDIEIELECWDKVKTVKGEYERRIPPELPTYP
jgi:hypothetical protein